MDLSTPWLGFTLPHPFVVGASPIGDDLDSARRAEDAGAAAIVVRSLFEEQIDLEESGRQRVMVARDHGHAEAQSYFPAAGEFVFDHDRYLDHIAALKRAVHIPVIGSLNGVTASGWLRFAQYIAEAGADALELNVYHVATDPEETSQHVEDRVVDIVRTVRGSVAIPISVKLSPFYSALAGLSRRIVAAGANGLVLFNRFYQPELDIEALEVRPALHLSTSAELNLRLHWLAVLSGRVQASLACSGGVHTPIDALQAVMAGAHAVQTVSALLQQGVGHLGALRDGVSRWLEEHEYESLRQAQGSLSLARCPDPMAFERGNYMRVLRSWRQ